MRKRLNSCRAGEWRSEKKKIRNKRESRRKGEGGGLNRRNAWSPVYGRENIFIAFPLSPPVPSKGIPRTVFYEITRLFVPRCVLSICRIFVAISARASKFVHRLSKIGYPPATWKLVSREALTQFRCDFFAIPPRFFRLLFRFSIHACVNSERLPLKQRRI